LDRDAQIAIVAVPGESAQDVTDKLVSAGIRAILNFAPARLKVPRDFQWRAGGPVKRAYGARVMAEFLKGRFDGPLEMLRFEAKELSGESAAVVRRKLERLAAEFNELAEVDASLPARRRTSAAILVALRPWEFSVVNALKKRKPT